MRRVHVDSIIPYLRIPSCVQIRTVRRDVLRIRILLQLARYVPNLHIYGCCIRVHGVFYLQGYHAVAVRLVIAAIRLRYQAVIRGA